MSDYVRKRCVRFKIPQNTIDEVQNEEDGWAVDLLLEKYKLQEAYKETNKKAILGIRNTESALRKKQYQSCFTKDKKFTPIWDLTDELLEQIIEKYDIEVPKVYEHISRTGCMDCPYRKL